MKPVFVLRHVAQEHLGRIAASLEGLHIPFRYFDLRRQPDVPLALEESSGLIAMGGPMSANDKDDFVRRELYLIEEAVRRNLPLLGVCLGAQLIAKAAGSRVYANPTTEIGWFPVHRTNETFYDPLFCGFGDTEVVFQWHKETFDLPAGALLLAKSDACRNQAFRIGRSVYGMQFHLEVTPEMIVQWVRQDEESGEEREAPGPIDPRQNIDRQGELCEQVVNEWSVFLEEE